MENNRKINVLIYEDDDALRESLCLLIGTSPGLALVGAFPDCDKVRSQMEALAPDVIIMDIQMPGIGGIEGIELAKQTDPTVEVVMFTTFGESEEIDQCIRNGATGYLLKDSPRIEIIDAIEKVYNGDVPMSASVKRKLLGNYRDPSVARRGSFPDLSDREWEVAMLLCQGKSYKMVADESFIAIDTVRGHVRNLYRKLNVHSLGELSSKLSR